MIINIENPTSKQLKTLKMINYMLINMINNKKYIGKAYGTFFGRYSKGKWWKKPANNYLKNAIRKYGKKNFKISIIKYDIETTEKVDELERVHIKEFKTQYPNGYNILPGGNKQDPDNTIGAANIKSCVLYNHRTEQVVDVINISKFSRDNNADFHTLIKVINGEHKQHKQWTLPETKIRKWFIISPWGEEFKIIDGDVSNFCKKFNLTPQNFSKMINKKKFRHHKGWRLKERPEEEKIIKCPNGDIVIIKYGQLTEFCKNNNLSISSMNTVYNNKRLEYNGFRLLENETAFFKKFKPLKYYFISNKFGVIYTFTNPHEFANKNNIKVDSLLQLLRKDIDSTHGWFLPEHNAKIFWLESPNGVIFNVLEGKPFGSFCKDKKLKVGCVLNVIKDGQKQHGGWKKSQPPIDYQI